MKQVAVLSMCLAFPFLSVSKPAPVASQAEIQQLIKQLGSDDFQQREQASRALGKCPDALPELRTALLAPDPEVRLRAELLIEEMERQCARRGLGQAARFAANGEVDQAVERLVRWAKMDSEGDSLQSLFQFAGRLIAWEEQRFDAVGLRLECLDCFGDLTVFRRKESRRLTARASRLPLLFKGGADVDAVLLRGAGVQVAAQSVVGLVASSGDVIANASREYAGLIFACGSVTLPTCGTSVIVSDGDVHVVGEEMYGSVIIARGDVTLPSRVCRSLILAGGKIKLPAQSELFKVAIRNYEQYDWKSPVTFFEPWKLGLKLEPDEQVVQVRQVEKGKPFAAAGLRPGDVITAVAGTKVANPEVFRKRLRAALAECTPTVRLTFRREGKSFEARLRVED